MEVSELIILYVVFFGGMTAFALLINRILLRFVKTLGTKNQPGAVVRWSDETKPAIGGLTFFIIFLISVCAYAIAFDANNIFNSNKPILGLIIASTLAFVLGLADDAYNTRPILKFLVQVLCGVILVVTNTQIELFENDWLNMSLTVIWVVGIMNSINMLDNMDGISTSVSAFILTAALGYLVIHQEMYSVDFLIILGVLAALFGFLYFNWHPSKMYMGDTGSQFLGIFLGYIGIEYCWNAENLVGDTGLLFGITALLLVFILPITDTATVTINRLLKKQSPFIGGKDHTTHNLSYLGFTDKQVAAFYCFISGLSVVFYLLFISFYNSKSYLISLLYVGYFVVIFMLLFGITRHNKKRNIGVEHRKQLADKK